MKFYHSYGRKSLGFGHAEKAPRQLRSTIIVLMFGALLGSQAQAENPAYRESYQHTQHLTRAIGRIFLSHQSSLALLDVCAQHYSHLAAAAERAQAQLLQANQPHMDRAHMLQTSLTRRIAEQQTRFDAEKFSLDIQLTVQDNVRQFRELLADYPQHERHYVCNRLILSVQAGEWNVAVREPEAVQVLQDAR